MIFLATYLFSILKTNKLLIIIIRKNIDLINVYFLKFH